MKNILILAALALTFAVPASAGEDYRCTNACPLAKQANTHRATGTESVRASRAVREDVAKTVAGNLKRI